MPLRVSCCGPVLRLFTSRGADPVPSSPCLAWGHAPPCGQACFCVLALRAVGAARGRPGGAPLAWALGVRGRALSHARPSILWGVRPGPATHWLWVWGVRAWGPVTNPTARAVGAARGRPRGGASCLGVGRPGSGALPPPTARPFGRAAGAHYPLAVGAGGAGLGTRPQPHRARSCELALRAVGRAGGSLGGGASCLGVGRPGSGALPPPTARFSGRAAGSHYPLAVGAGDVGVGTRHPPHSARSCELAFRLVGAAGGRPGGGASCLCVGRPGSGALPSPTARPLGRAAGAHYPLALAGGCGRGDPSPTPQSALLRAGFVRCGGGTRAPRGGASCLCVGPPGSGTLPAPTAHPLGRAAGAHDPLAVGAGGAGIGTRHQPHSARSCELALCAVRAARGRPGGALLAWAWGVRGRALSHPRPLVPWGVRPGPTTHWLWVRGVWAWGTVTNPTARTLASWLCALWGGKEGAWGGRFLPGCGASGVRRSPIPGGSSFGACGRGPLPTACGCRQCGCGDPSPTKQHALLRAGFACCGGGMRSSGGSTSCLGVGHLGSGALPPPTACPLGRAAVAHYPLAVAAGDAGVGTRPEPHSARSCEMALRAVGAARGRLGGGCILPGCGASGLGRSPTPERSSFEACGRGRLPTGCGCRGCGRGDPSPTPQRALLRAGFACCGGGTRAPRGGASCLGARRLGLGALFPPTAPPLWRAVGAHYPLAGGAGGVGLGTRHPPHSARSWELALRAVGAARGRPVGAPLACVRGVRGRALSHPRALVLWGVRPGPTTHWLWMGRV